MTTRLFVLLIAILSLPSVVLAGDEGGEARSAAGPYGGISFDVGIEQFRNTGPFGDFDEAYGFDLWAGYRTQAGIAVEVEVTYLNGFDSTLLGFPVEFEAWAITGNLKLTPLEGRFQPYLVVGAGPGFIEVTLDGPGSANPSADEEGVVVRLGGGLDYYFTDTVGVVVGAEYLLTDDDIEDTDLIKVKVGLQVRM